MPPVTVGLADTTPAHPANLARIQSAAQKSGFKGHLLLLAIPAQAGQLALCDSVLLMGLSSGTAAAMAEHMQFRDALSQAGVPYQVIYSLDEHQLVERLAFMQGQQMPSSNRSRATWVWACEKCSDPRCEHRLLTDLIQQRQSAA